MKANRQLTFLKRNIPINNTKFKEITYKGQYLNTLLNPRHKKYVKQIEMIQRRAARFTHGRFNNTSSVTEMLNQFQWESLEQCRKVACVMMFYEIQ